MAPPKTDKEREKDAQHLKRMLTMARKGPINFGIALGKEKPEDLAFLAHQRKNPKSLRKQAREETGNSKGAHGEMTVDGKHLVFVCQDTPPGPLVKAMRLFLRDLKVPLRAEFRLPEEAAGPAKAAPAEGAEAEKPGRKDKAIMQLRAAFKKLVAQAKDAIAADPDVRGGLLATLKEIDENLNGGEPQAARDGIIKAGALLKSLAGREVKAGGANASSGTAEPSTGAADYVKERADQIVRTAEKFGVDAEEVNRLLKYARSAGIAMNPANIALSNLERFEKQVTIALDSGVPQSTIDEILARVKKKGTVTALVDDAFSELILGTIRARDGKVVVGVGDDDAHGLKQFETAFGERLARESAPITLPIHELDALIRRYKNQGSLDGPLNQLEEALLVQISELADGGVKGLYIYDDLEKTFMTADDGFLKAVQEQLEERVE